MVMIGDDFLYKIFFSLKDAEDILYIYNLSREICVQKLTVFTQISNMRLSQC
jgi:hypothetical protein